MSAIFRLQLLSGISVYTPISEFLVLGNLSNTDPGIPNFPLEFLIPVGRQSFTPSIAPKPLNIAYFGSLNLQLFTPAQPQPPFTPIDWRGPDATTKPYQLRENTPPLNINLFPPPTPLPEGKQSFANPTQPSPYIGFDFVSFSRSTSLPVGQQSYVAATPPTIPASWWQTNLTITTLNVVGLPPGKSVITANNPVVAPTSFQQQNIITQTLASATVTPVGKTSASPSIAATPYNAALFPNLLTGTSQVIPLPDGEESYVNPVAPKPYLGFTYPNILTSTLSSTPPFPAISARFHFTQPTAPFRAFQQTNLLETTLADRPVGQQSFSATIPAKQPPASFFDQTIFLEELPPAPIGQQNWSESRSAKVYASSFEQLNIVIRDVAPFNNFAWFATQQPSAIPTTFAQERHTYYYRPDVPGDGSTTKWNANYLAGLRAKRDLLAKSSKERQMLDAEILALMAKYRDDDDGFMTFPLEDVLAKQQADEDDLIIALMMSM